MPRQLPAPRDPLPATLLAAGGFGLGVALLGRLVGGRLGFGLATLGLALTVGCGVLFAVVVYWPREG